MQNTHYSIIQRHQNDVAVICVPGTPNSSLSCSHCYLSPVDLLDKFYSAILFFKILLLVIKQALTLKDGKLIFSIRRCVSNCIKRGRIEGGEMGLAGVGGSGGKK